MQYQGPELKVGVVYKFTTKERWAGGYDVIDNRVLFCEDGNRFRLYFQSKLTQNFVETSVIRKDIPGCLYAYFSGYRPRQYFVDGQECFFTKQ